MTEKPVFTTMIQPPPGPDAKLGLPCASSTNPPVFNDAMTVRVRVFVDEQHCSAEAEIDSDDTRSWQWVMSAATPSGNVTVAVIRLVPPPQLPHNVLMHPQNTVEQNTPEYNWGHEPCIKLTRVAVLPEYRGLGLGRQLVETALAWAAEHAVEINEAAAQAAIRSHHMEPPASWEGLVLVHAQTDVEHMYARMGFETDISMGRWDEEGIEHVGMFRRVTIVH